MSPLWSLKPHLMRDEPAVVKHVKAGGSLSGGQPVLHHALHRYGRERGSLAVGRGGGRPT